MPLLQTIILAVLLTINAISLILYCIVEFHLKNYIWETLYMFIFDHKNYKIFKDIYAGKYKIFILKYPSEYYKEFDTNLSYASLYIADNSLMGIFTGHTKLLIGNYFPHHFEDIFFRNKNWGEEEDLTPKDEETKNLINLLEVKKYPITNNTTTQ